ncbi:MAG: hypothetical protein AAB897_00400 [Patescibacteria group bacterium]
MQIFLICSVRKADEKERAAQLAYVKKLEMAGHEVYWPTRDNPHQKTDLIGLLICDWNREAIFLAQEIHIWYSSDSEGSKFDFGMVFMLNRSRNVKIVIANPEAVRPTPHKSFENVLLALTGNL